VIGLAGEGAFTDQGCARALPGQTVELRQHDTRRSRPVSERHPQRQPLPAVNRIEHSQDVVGFVPRGRNGGRARPSALASTWSRPAVRSTIHGHHSPSEEGDPFEVGALTGSGALGTVGPETWILAAEAVFERSIAAGRWQVGRDQG